MATAIRYAPAEQPPPPRRALSRLVGLLVFAAAVFVLALGIAG